MYHNPIHQIAISRNPFISGFALLFLTVGCATPWEKSALLSDNTPNIERIQGPTQRSLLNWKKKKQDEDDKIAGKSLKPIKGTEEYLAATSLFEAKKYEEARKAFKKVARDFKKSEIREDALFMEAECAWQKDQYATAHDAYAVLLKDFPSTRHMNVVSERLFKIGRLWLEFPEVANVGEIRQVNFDDPKKALPPEETPKVPKAVPIFVPNFSDKQKPLFDTAGNGVAALTAVWMNDPTGPLADDAMMLVASYHARRGNYVEADRFFQMLRETFPNSPHVENAFVLGSHVKLMSYQGPDYETRTLQEAQLLKESTLKLYPNNSEADRIKDELVRIEEQKALVLYNTGNFYVHKGKPRAGAVYFHQLINEYPKTSYRKLAREKLAELGPEYASGAIFLTPNDPPKKDILQRIQDTVSLTPQKKNSAIDSTSNGDRPIGRSGSRTSDGSSSNSGQKEKAAEGSRNGEYEDPSDEVEQAPNVDPEKPAKKRRSWFFGKQPEKLPESDDNPKQLGSGSSR